MPKQIQRHQKRQTAAPMTSAYLAVLATLLWITCDDNVPTWAVAVPIALAFAPLAVLFIAAAPFPHRAVAPPADDCRHTRNVLLENKNGDPQ